MFLREAPTETLADVANRLDDNVESITVAASTVALQTGAGVIVLGTREIPMTEDSLKVVGSLISVPDAFGARLPPATRETLYNDLLTRSPDTVVARITGHDELLTMRDPHQASIEPRRIVDMAGRVMGTDALVESFYNGPDQFWLDAFMPTDAGRGIGGDPVMGDITAAGLYFRQNVKQNLTPEVSRRLYRLVCTNGMSLPDETLKVEGRGNTVDEVLRDLELAARRAFEAVETDMEHFYDMRNEVVEHPDRLVSRIAIEAGLSPRIRLSLVEGVPTILGEDAPVTMFDVVNYITNQANDPTISLGTRRILQSLGGAVVSQHVDRCGSCNSKIR